MRMSPLLLVLPLLLGTATAREPRGARGPNADAVPEVVVAVADPCPGGCINFVINVHDVNHVDDSADTILHLVDIFSRSGVKGEFYLTGAICELFLAQRPDVVSRLRSSGMTVSYHVRAPHPLVNGFDGKLVGTDAEREAVLRDYETYALDRRTGELDRTRPGGYTLVRDTFGSAVTVVTPNKDPLNKRAALHVYRSLGARAVVWYHEEGAALAAPLTLREGLVVRPSDIGLTRWLDRGGVEQFWWNRVGRDAAFNPTSRLKERLATWKAGGARGAFVTSLVHENNFYRFGPEGWTLSYYSGKDKDTPLPPPWNVNPEEVSRVRGKDEQDAIWTAYEDMVRWSKGNLRVVTGTELADMVTTAPAATAGPTGK